MDPPPITPPPNNPISYPIARTPTHENRLSIPFILRFPAATIGAFLTGMGLGISHGGKTSGMRFRAENSHRFPSTSTGWYLYHKSKNYHMMFGGIKEGMKMGSKIAFWAGGFFLVEEAVDRVRGTKDFVSTVLAGLSISGGFSAWKTDRFPFPTAVRTARVGLYSGLAFGLVQDALGLVRGRRLAYVDFLLGRRRTLSDLEEVQG